MNPVETAIMDALGDLGGTATAREIAERIAQGCWWKPSAQSVGRCLATMSRAGLVTDVGGQPRRWTAGGAPSRDRYSDAVLEALRESPLLWTTSAQLCARPGECWDPRSVGHELAHLEDLGLVERYPGVKPALWRARA